MLPLIGGRQRGRPGVVPGSLFAPFLLSRSQPSSFSAVFGADGLTWREFGADVPRFNGPTRRLVLEGQRTNLLTNPRGNSWSLNAVTAPLSEVGPSGAPNDALLVTELATSASHWSAPSGFSATNGLPYALTVFARPGSASLIQLAFSGASHGNLAFANFILSGLGALGTVGSAATAQIVRFGDWYRCLLLSTAASTTAGATVFFPMIETSADARNPVYLGTGRSLTLAWAQLEQASSPSSPILPPIGAPASPTRGPEAVSASLASLGIPSSGACTVLLSGVLPQAAATGTNPHVLQLDDGTANNRIAILNGGGTSALSLLHRLAGSGTSAAIGAFVAGSPFRVGLTVFGDGTAIASINGGPVATLSGVPVSGLSDLRIGSRAGGADAMFGEVGHLRVLRSPLAAGALRSAVALLPI